MAGDYTPTQVAELIGGGEIQLIDVRQEYEHDAARIEGDRLIALGDLPAQAGTIDPGRPVVFYCYSGARSAAATAALRAAGFDAHNMVGGILAWVAAGLPLQPDGAEIVH
jgi:rhodanese-related sulfurtransferase